MFATISAGFWLLTQVAAPGPGDLRDFVTLRAPELGQVEIIEARPAGGGWIAIEGTAVLAEDIFARVYDGPTRCGVGLGAYSAALDGRQVVVQTASVGDTVVFAFEVVAEMAEPGTPRATGPIEPAPQGAGFPTGVNQNGWRLAATFGDYTHPDGRKLPGFRRSWWGERLSDGLIVGTPGFEALCAAARRIESGSESE